MSEGRKLNILEKAIRLVPGYKGYKRKEERRDNDYLFRMLLVSRMEKLITVLNEAAGSLKGPSSLVLVNDFDRVSKKLEKSIDLVRFADRGYRGWFDIHKVQENELDKLYNFDIALVEDITELEKTFGCFSAAGNDADLLKGCVNEIIILLNDYDDKLASRRDLMIDLEKNRPID